MSIVRLTGGYTVTVCKNAMTYSKDYNSTLRYECDETFSDECVVKKTFFARVSYEILYHEVWKCGFPHAKRKTVFSHTHFHTRSEIKIYSLTLRQWFELDCLMVEKQFKKCLSPTKDILFFQDLFVKLNAKDAFGIYDHLSLT